jgi:Polyketide cyclase / dehydrase and lipid transport
MTLIRPEDTTVPVTVQTRSALPPDRAFQPGGHAGVSRNPILSDGSMATEKITEYTPGHSFAYEVTGFTNVVLRKLVYGVRGEWTYTPDTSGTVIRWTYEFKPLRRRYWLVRHMLAPLWRHYMQAGVEAAARVAEERERAAVPRLDRCGR